MRFHFPGLHVILAVGNELPEENAMRFSLSLAALIISAGLTPALAQDQNLNRQQLQTPLPPLDDALVGGKTYRDWLRELSSNDPAVKESAIQAMVIYGSQPQYSKAVRKEAGPALISVLNDTYTSDASIKVNAALAVGTILLEEKDMEKGVAALTRLLSDNESIVRLYATTALSNFGADNRDKVQSLARKAIPNLVPMVRDKASWEIRRAAVVGLTQLAWDKTVKEGGPDPQAFRALTTAIGDRCLQVRQEAVKGYIWIGPPLIASDAKKSTSTKADLDSAVKALDGLAYQRDKSTAILARVAILRIDPPRLNNAQVVDKYLQEICRLMRPPSDLQLRVDASYGLTIIWQTANSSLAANPPNPKAFIKTTGWGEVIHMAVLNLDDKDDTIICWACNVLGTMGPGAEKAIKDLERAKVRMASRKNDDITKQKVDWALARCHGKEGREVGAADNKSGD
jgi:hypothetical protein